MKTELLKKKKPELLIPVGGIKQLKAAIANGADAVYMGGNEFNARINADNFSLESIKQAIEFAHEYGVKVHITHNTLVANEEVNKALEHAVKMYELGADAIIVQDRGFANLLHNVVPEIPLHLSTQASVHSIEGVREAENAGFSRVILARELSAGEIADICKNSNAEIEIFVHGAICICYSGQCHLSHFIGGRSGNRGVCAQACRLPYTLEIDGIKQTNRNSYLLSPADMCLLEHIPEIMKMGIDSLKIEGRMKSAEYVAAVTSIYREHIDNNIKRNEETAASSINTADVSDSDINVLKRIYNRGNFTDAYFNGRRGSSLMSEDVPKHQGVAVGNIISVKHGARGHLIIKLKENLFIGDGIEVRCNGQACGNVVTYIKEAEREKNKANLNARKTNNNKSADSGNKVNGLVKSAPAGSIVEVGDINFGNMKIDKDSVVYRITDKSLMSELQSTYEKIQGRIHCKMEFRGVTGEKAHLKVIYEDLHNDSNDEYEKYDKNDMHDKSGKNDSNPRNIKNVIVIDKYSEFPLELAINKSTEKENVEKNLIKTGGTPYQITACNIILKGEPLIPLSVINSMRRAALTELTARRLAKAIPAPEQIISAENSISSVENSIAEMQKTYRESFEDSSAPDENIIFYFYDTAECLKKAETTAKIILEQGLAENAELFIPYQKLERFIQLEVSGKIKIVPYLPPIMSDKELKKSHDIINELRSTGKIKGVSLANSAQIRTFAEDEIELYFDENFNIYNSNTFLYHKSQGMKRGVLSHEIDGKKIKTFTGTADLCEFTVYGRIPVMISAHCPVGDSLEPDENVRANPSFRCKKKTSSLIDRKNERFPIITECEECKSMILSYKPLNRLRSLAEYRKDGIKNFRIYVFDEDETEIENIIEEMSKNRQKN